MADPHFLEATGEYGASRRGLTSKERLFYLSDLYFASKPGQPETADFRTIANQVRKLDQDALSEPQKEQLGRTLCFRLEQNAKAQQYVDALNLHRLPRIQDWAMHLYRHIKEEGSDEDVTVGINAVARKFVPIIEKERFFHAPEVPGDDYKNAWRGPYYRKPAQYLACSMAAAGYTLADVERGPDKLKQLICSGYFEDSETKSYRQTDRYVAT